MKSAGKARSNGLYRHIRTSKEIIRNLLNYSVKNIRKNNCLKGIGIISDSLFVLNKECNMIYYTITVVKICVKT